MQTTPDFDDVQLKEAFLSFRGAGLPPSPHSSGDAHVTVRRRHRTRLALVAAGAALVVAAPIAAVQLSDHPNRTVVPPATEAPPSTVDDRPTPTTPPTSTPPTEPGWPPAPKARHDPGVNLSENGATAQVGSGTGLTFAVGPLLLEGSVGSPPADVQVTVRNNGPAAVDQLDLIFQLGNGVATTGSAWTGCARDTAASTVTCVVPAPVVGATRDYNYRLTLNTSGFAIPALTVIPHGMTGVDLAANTAHLLARNNGGAETDITLAASRLVTEGATGQQPGILNIAVGNAGPWRTNSVELTFHYSAGVQPDAASFVGCARDEANKTMKCTVLAPDPGELSMLTYRFVVDFQQAHTLTINATPANQPDFDQSDNSVTVRF